MSNTPIDRKDEILGHLHAHLRVRSRRRRIARAASAGTVMLALAAAVYFTVPSSPGTPSDSLFTHNGADTIHSAPGPAPTPTPVQAPTMIAAASHVTVRIAGTDPLPTTPCVANSTATICILSDDQLLAELARAGRPSGLVRTGGTAYVVPNGPTASIQ